VLSEQFLLALPKSGSERLTACVKKTRAFVTECVCEGQASGAFRADLPADTLAPIVMGTVQMLALAPAANRRRNAEARAVLDSLLVLLRPPIATPSPTKKRSP